MGGAVIRKRLAADHSRDAIKANELRIFFPTIAKSKQSGEEGEYYHETPCSLDQDAEESPSQDQLNRTKAVGRLCDGGAIQRFHFQLGGGGRSRDPLSR